MTKNLFIETLKITDGRFSDPELNWQRIVDTQTKIFGKSSFSPLDNNLIPTNKRQGLVKCRIIYGSDINQISFDNYTPRHINSLKIVDGRNLDYSLKYEDRSDLTQLRQQIGQCDEILICQNGKITDTGYSNVVLFDGIDYVTPSTYLLNGTKRRLLLQKGIISERDISIADLHRYKHLYLINAMLDLDDKIIVNIEYIYS